MEPNGEHAQRSPRLEKIAWYKNINKYIGDDECLYNKIQKKNDWNYISKINEICKCAHVLMAL